MTVRFNPRRAIGNWTTANVYWTPEKSYEGIHGNPYQLMKWKKNVFISYPNEPRFGVYTLTKKIYKINLKP